MAPFFTVFQSIIDHQANTSKVSYDIVRVNYDTFIHEQNSQKAAVDDRVSAYIAKYATPRNVQTEEYTRYMAEREEAYDAWIRSKTAGDLHRLVGMTLPESLHTTIPNVYTPQLD
jgi:hypothetical protein